MKTSLILGLLSSASVLLGSTATAQQEAPPAKEKRIVVKKKNSQQQAGPQSEKRAALLAEASKLNKKAAHLAESGDLEGAAQASRKAANLLQQASRTDAKQERQQEREARVRVRERSQRDQQARAQAEVADAFARSRAEVAQAQAEVLQEEAHANYVEALKNMNLAIEHGDLAEALHGQIHVEIDGDQFDLAQEHVAQQLAEHFQLQSNHQQDLANQWALLHSVEALEGFEGLEGLANVHVFEGAEGLEFLNSLNVDVQGLTDNFAQFNVEVDDVAGWLQSQNSNEAATVYGWAAGADGRIELPEEGEVNVDGENMVYRRLAIPHGSNSQEVERFLWFSEDGEAAHIEVPGALERYAFSFTPGVTAGGEASFWSSVAECCGEECEDECCGDCGQSAGLLLNVAPNGLATVDNLFNHKAHEGAHEHAGQQGGGLFTFRSGSESECEHECGTEDIRVFGSEDGMRQIIIHGNGGTQNITIHGSMHGAPASSGQSMTLQRMGRAEARSSESMPSLRRRIELAVPAPERQETVNQWRASVSDAGGYRIAIPREAGSAMPQVEVKRKSLQPEQLEDARKLIQDMRAEMEALRQELNDLRKQMKDDPLVQLQRRPSLQATELPSQPAALARLREGAVSLAGGR